MPIAIQSSLLKIALLTCFAVQSHAKFWFKDVASGSGLVQPRPTLKFGGPCVADIDGDGYYDLILSYHNEDLPQIYFGSRSGKFTLAPFETPVYDIHGVAVAQRTAWTRQRIVAISVGGGMGTFLRPPLFYLTGKGRVITDISRKYGLGRRKSRGRNVVFMDLSMKGIKKRRRNKGGPDMVVVNFLGNSNSLRQYAYQNIKGKYVARRIKGFERETRGRVEVTDIDGDGIMELISIRKMRIYKLKAPFHFEDVSERFLPDGIHTEALTGTSVVEFDYDNDGDFDLYVARSDQSLVSHMRRVSLMYSHDLLLENRNGTYVDVSEQAGIPRKTNSMGVTAGDFNNDGYVDLFVSQWNKLDILLLNKGNGKFEKRIGMVPKKKRAVGNHAVAVDYNLDGKCDLIVGQGNVNGWFRGDYLLMKNQMKFTGKNHYLLVRVGNEPSLSTTNLHAVVKVLVGGMIMTQRVGSRGAQGGGGSLIDTLHFGLGRRKKVTAVRVVWTTGVSHQRNWVRTDRMIHFGTRFHYEDR